MGQWLPSHRSLGEDSGSLQVRELPCRLAYSDIQHLTIHSFIHLFKSSSPPPFVSSCSSPELALAHYNHGDDGERPMRAMPLMVCSVFKLQSAYVVGNAK